MVQVNPIYLIFNPVHFLVDSSEKTSFVMNASGTTTEMTRKKGICFSGHIPFRAYERKCNSIFRAYERKCNSIVLSNQPTIAIRRAAFVRAAQAHRA